ncbi:MAG: PQQ-binding-like beta-propeller repeat protein, partial [Sphingomonadaceae bacterium]|nr:PQQ-binding-like beta-propeller repeat protein [Sphingomonadaceae bacterium]
MRSAGNQACRGVSYTKTGEGTQSCAQRIILGTLDSRLIALDAMTGKPCEDFGENGQVR